MEQQTTRMIRFLDGDLSEEEGGDLQRELSTSQEARQDLQLLRDIGSYSSDADKLSFRDKLDLVSREFTKKSFYTRHRQLLAYAAAALILTTAGMWSVHHYFFSAKNNQALFAQYFQPYPAANTTRSLHITEGKADAAFEVYNNKDYETAYTLFSAAVKQNPAPLSQRFYLGICALETGRTEQAIELFAHLQDTTRNPYAKHAQWYLALSWLKAGEREKSEQMFRLIGEADNMYSLLAREILKKLN